MKDRQKARQTDKAEIARGKRERERERNTMPELFLLPSRAYIKCVACIWKTVG